MPKLVTPSIHHIYSISSDLPESGTPKTSRLISISYFIYGGRKDSIYLQILREIGISAYTKAAGLLSGPDRDWYRYLESEIQQHYVGPDCYWKSPREPNILRCTNFFGNAWWIPFPPTLVRQIPEI